MSLFAEQAAFLLDICRLVQMATNAGFAVAGRELGRTPEQQALYVKSGRSQTMASNHLRNCALDLYFMRDGQLVYDRATLLPLGEYWKSLSSKNDWGGFWHSFKDLPHFERRP
jgi:hypothetical protein